MGQWRWTAVALGFGNVLLPSMSYAQTPVAGAERAGLSGDEVQERVGAEGGTFQVLDRQASVWRPREAQGEILVRGIPMAENRTYLDGMLLPFANHATGRQAVLAPRAIERLSLYSSGVPVDYGDVRGSVLELRLKSPAACAPPEASATIPKSVVSSPGSAESAGASLCRSVAAAANLRDVEAEVSLSTEALRPKGWGLRVAGRQSVTEPFVRAFTSKNDRRWILVPTYSDVHATVEVRPAAQARLSFRVFVFEEQLSLLERFPADSQAQAAALLPERSFYGVQGLWSQRLSSRVSLDSSLSLTETKTGLFPNDALIPVGFKLETARLRFRSAFQFDLGPRLQLRTGMDQLAEWWQFSGELPAPPAPGEPAPPPFSPAEPMQVSGSVRRFLPAAFGSLTWTPMDALRLDAASRLEAAQGGVQLSPRLSALLSLPWRMSVALQASLLRQRGAPLSEEPLWQQARVAQLSVNQALGRAVRLVLDLYARQAELPSGGAKAARQYGAELGAAVVPSSEVALNFGVSARQLQVLSEQGDQQSGFYAPIVGPSLSAYDPWHQPLVLVGGVTVRPHEGLSLRASYRGGAGYSGRSQDLFPTPSQIEPSSEQSEFIHQLDLKVDGRTRLGGVDWSCFVELVNATGAERGDALGWQFGDTSEVVRPFASRALNLGVRATL